MKLRLERVRLPIAVTLAQLIGLADGDVAAAEANMRYFERCEHYRDDTYHVALDREAGALDDGMRIWHLSIKRHDREPIRDWRVMQALKTAVVGPDHEGIELYPAESRVVDTANQYHIWVFATPDGGPFCLPIGFSKGLRVDAGENELMQRVAPKAKQRAFEKEST
jgi:hypothetical protein